MHTKIGTIHKLNRYPVKSFSGESLTGAKVERYGLYGDRCYAFADEKSPVKYLTAKHVPSLISYQAALTGQEKKEAFPDVTITSPEGKTYSWDDNTFYNEMEELSNRELKPVKFSPQTADMMAFDQANILLVTKASLDALEEEWGKRVSHLRFRPNIVLDSDDGIPFKEKEWLGQQIQINNVVFKIYKQCKRCTMVNIDPENYAIDKTLLKTLAQKHEVNFGVYASVVRTGDIRVGDEVELTID